MSLEIIKEFDCGHKVWGVFNKDVIGYPKDFTGLYVQHECDKIKVYAKKKGLQRFYIFKSNSMGNSKKDQSED